MPKKPSDKEPDQVSQQSDAVVPAPRPAPTEPVITPEPPAPVAERQSTVRTRSQRNRRLVWLSVAFTTLIGAVWTAVASSLVENGRTYFEDKLFVLRGGLIIKDLNDQLTAEEAKYDALVVSGNTSVVAYVAMAYRSQEFCVNEVRAWADQKRYPYIAHVDSSKFITIVTYSAQKLTMRCVGGPWVDTTFLVISGTEANVDQVNFAHRELYERLAQFSAYPSAVFPQGTNWISTGPYAEVGYVTFEMRYTDYKLWVTTGRLPSAMFSAMIRPGTFQKTLLDKGFYFLTFVNPGRSVTFRSPEPGNYAVLAADGTWQVSQDQLAALIPPPEGTLVRTKVLVIVTGEAYGREDRNSVDSRYLGDDAKITIAGIPGIVDGGAMEPLIRNW